MGGLTIVKKETAKLLRENARLKRQLTENEQRTSDLEDAVVELAGLYAEQDDALVELADLVAEGE